MGRLGNFIQRCLQIIGVYAFGNIAEAPHTANGFAVTDLRSGDAFVYPSVLERQYIKTFAERIFFEFFQWTPVRRGIG